MMDGQDSFSHSPDIEPLTAEGMEEQVDERTLFCTPAPLAASTVARDTNRARQLMMAADSRGSFLDHSDLSRLSLQSVTAADLTNQLMQLNFSSVGRDVSVASKSPAGNSGPDLIQFSASTVTLGEQGGAASEKDNSKSDSLTDVSSRSSMGLIPTDMLDELSASVLPLNTPKAAKKEPQPARQKPDSTVRQSKEQGRDSTEWSSTDTSKHETKHSTDWSDSSRHDSKQDSKDMPLGCSQLDTVKKKPLTPDSQSTARPFAGLRGGVALFTGGVLDNVQEANELDHSVYDVELGAEDLRQLDADFSDFDGDGGLESGDEDFGFDEEPMFSLPERKQDSQNVPLPATSQPNHNESPLETSAQHNQTLGDHERTLQEENMEENEEEDRIGEGRESGEEDGGLGQLAASRSDTGLDSRYFHKTPEPFAGDGEDAELASSRSSLTAPSQERGAAEGEHLLTRLRRQFMSGDGSEIDTDDELEAARRSQFLAERPQGQGADDGDGNRNNLPQPVGFDDEDEQAASRNYSRKKSDQSQQSFSYLTRQSGEGDADHSPVPWDGGGGGDGSSGGDSDDGKQGQVASQRYTSRVPQSQASVSQAPATSVVSTTGRESGLQADFFLPSSVPADSELGTTQALEGSTFHVEDLLKPPLNTSAGREWEDGVGEPRLEASGFNADDNQFNPFEGELAGLKSSFGSFGLEPGDENNSSDAVYSSPRPEEGGVINELPTSAGDNRKLTHTVSAAHNSGSFDGPFRKPKAPLEKKNKKKEPEQTPSPAASPVTNLSKNVGFLDADGINLEEELRQLGISCDDFQTANDAEAMLAADEKQFEEEHKFSEHHQLAVAAEGLSWEANEDHFSGYLGGEDQPEHLEVSIGTYIATRTETLGTLGGDPARPRPEFGKPVHSPPHSREPIKFMSPPPSASTSSISLLSRTEGEGNEDGDVTLMGSDFDATGESVTATSAPQSQPTPARPEQLAETTLHDELSSLFLDLTSNASTSDLSMEDALSMSSIMNFVKKHNFMKSADFASAVVKFSNARRQQSSMAVVKTEGSRKTGDKRQNTGIVHSKTNSPSGAGDKAVSVSKQGAPATAEQAYKSQSSSRSAKSGAGVPFTSPPALPSPRQSASSTNSPFTSTMRETSSLADSQRQKGSRLPVRVGSGTPTNGDKQRERTLSAQGHSHPAAGPLNKSQSVSQIPSHVQHCVEDLPGDVTQNRQSAVIRAGQHTGKGSQDGKAQMRDSQNSEKQDNSRGTSRQLHRQDIDGGSQRKSVSNPQSIHPGVKSSMQVSRQEQGPGSRKPQHPESQGVQAKPSEKQDITAVTAVDRNGSSHDPIPWNIPQERQAGVRKPAGSQRGVSVGGRDDGDHSSHTSARLSSETSSSPYAPTFQTPATKLPSSGKSDARAVRGEHHTVHRQSTFQDDLEHHSSGRQISQDSGVQSGMSGHQGSPRSTAYSHHIPDGMENSPVTRHHPGNDFSRQEAVGVEDVELMESRQFDFVDDASKLVSQQWAEPSQQWTEPPFAGEETRMYSTINVSCQDAHMTQAPQSMSKPTLLTGTSLLKTDFAQKYLASGDHGRPPVDPQHLRQQQSQGVFKQPQLPVSVAKQSRHPTASENCNANVSRAPSCIQSFGGRQYPQPPPAMHSTNAGLNETTASVYYELNEDLQQTTVMGDLPESSVLNSFWGKSPLYQSTPALGVAKVPAVTMTTSKLDERELTTPGSLVTPRIKRQLIDVQRHVTFPEFCCLGVSQKTSFPVENRTAVGVVCRFSLAQLQHNGKTVNPELQSPFEFRPKLSIGSGAKEELTVLFVPKRPGEHVAHIEVFAQSLNPTLEPTSTIVQLHATAEVPSIQMSPSVEVLDYGDVMWGTCLAKSIKLRNLKRASLPVRLSVWSSSSVWHCFTFDSSANTSDVSIISMSNRPESLGRNVQTVILPGCEKDADAKVTEIQLYCRPPAKELNRALAERPAEKIEARVDVEVDTPVQYLPPLASLTVRATIGMPHLMIPPSHMSLSFKTQPNKSIQENVLLNNAGNIAMNLALSVTTFPECFTVSPARVTIKPGCQADISVIFSPLETDVHKYQSLLLMDIEPEGPSYEIPMEARVSVPAPAQRMASPSLLTSKSFLSFTGVPLNQTKSLTLRLFNKDSYRTEYASVEVRGATDCFKLVTVSGEWQQKCEVVIEPKEKVSLTVIFCPTAVQGYSGKLVIKTRDSYSTKYSIPLSGYGGRSVLNLSGACLTNSGQRWLELGSIKEAHNIMREVVLTNSGVRAAFVRASAFYDMPCKQAVHPGRVAMEPNNFVLAPGSSLKVVVAISPSQREVDLVRERKEVVAVVRFQHGDEVMRQKYQRALSREGGKVDQHSWQAAFSQQFANDSQDVIIQEGRTIPDSPDDSAAFFHQLTSVCVALLADPPPDRSASVPVSSAPRSRQSSTTSSPASVHSREDRTHSSSGQFLVPSRPDDSDIDWTVKPDHLSFTVGETNNKMLQLINFSRVPLRFELIWPPNSVVPEPQKGELKPRSSTSVEVWPHVAWQKRLADLPWRGELVISCNGHEKIVKVHVKNSEDPPLLALSSPHSSPSSVTSVSRRQSRDPSLSTTMRSLQLASTNIHFPKAKVNEQHESALELTNIATDPVHWKLSAFTPPYVKGADENNTVQRVEHSVFTIHPCSGDLLPNETVKVPVRFCPKTKGTYNQHWEVEYQPLSAGRPTQDTSTTKISLTAEVSSRESMLVVKHARESVSRQSTEPAAAQDKEKSSRRAPLQEKHPNTAASAVSEPPRSTSHELLLLNPDVRFSDTKVGQAMQVKVEFKNSFDHNVQLEVTAPKPPFKVKHMTFVITKRRFLKYPIEFRPTATGRFEDTMVFSAPQLNKTFTVRLTGQGV